MTRHTKFGEKTMKMPSKLLLLLNLILDVRDTH